MITQQKLIYLLIQISRERSLNTNQDILEPFETLSERQLHLCIRFCYTSQSSETYLKVHHTPYYKKITNASPFPCGGAHIAMENTNKNTTKFFYDLGLSRSNFGFNAPQKTLLWNFFYVWIRTDFTILHYPQPRFENHII